MRLPTLYALVGAMGLSLSSLRGSDTILHNFAGSADGQFPRGSLTLADGVLYGMTSQGGAGTLGTVFKLNPDGTGFGVLHNFTGGSADGSTPFGSLTISGSKLYGVTQSGGGGSGVAFSMNTDGSGFGLIHTFTGGATDGAFPIAALTLSGSRLYGTTVGGGSANLGTVFGVNTDGSGFSLLHTFTNVSTNGRGPRGTLLLAGAKLYGTTEFGGANSFGSIFSVNTDGTGFSLLHSFNFSASGAYAPTAALTQVGTKLYGTTASGGSGARGTVFSVNLDGTGFTVLHNFAGGSSDGSGPLGSLTLVGSKLYGTTNTGGIGNLGTVFSLNPDGTGFALIQNFAGQPSDGSRPQGDVTASLDSQTLYGMTNEGGTSNRGVVFSAPSGIPEPSSALLLLCGCGLLLRRTKRG